MQERRRDKDRRRQIRSGRRITDAQAIHAFCLETRLELTTLRRRVESLTDAVQALTASRKKP